MKTVEPIIVSSLSEASEADVVDGALAVISAPDASAATGYTTKKSLLSRIKDYIIGNTSISGVGDGTVTGAISALNSDLTNRTGYTYQSVPKASTFGAGTFNCNVFQYYKQAVVYLNVGLPSIAASTEALMCTLPEGSRPSQKLNTVAVTQSGTPIGLLLQWYTDGRITVFPLSAVNGQFMRGTFVIPTA